MLYRLEIENFYSVLEPQVIDLSVPKNVTAYPERFDEVVPGSDLRAPKVVAIFGANASGKSNVMKSLAFITWFVAHSFSYDRERLPFVPFLDENWQKRPTRLAIEFGGLSDLSHSSKEDFEDGIEVPQGTYRYELVLATSATDSTILNENLYHRPDGRGRWQRVFERGGATITGSKRFPIKNSKLVTDIVRRNASLVSTLVQLKHEPSEVLKEAAESVRSNILLDRADPTIENSLEYLASDQDALEALNRELQRIDLGLREMILFQGQNGLAARFDHVGLNEEILWSFESEGTKSFVRRFPLIFAALNAGGIAVIDELDASLHPSLLPEIISWFYDPERNKGGGSLWTTCHSASLLEDLTKEEVVLCEATRHGRTSVFSLMDVQKVRRSDNLYKKYLGGVFGAVPHVG